MIAAASLAAALALAAPDPCAPVAAAGAPDPSAAESYRAVGDAERAAGSRDTAAAAYRAALSRDPADARSRAALALLCADQARDGAFQRGLRRMESGDRRGAVAAFEEARAGGSDRSAALLEGICLYELGEDERARPLLAQAETDPAHRDAARFFLGLVALRAGRSADAAALLEASAADHRLGPAALDLARLARAKGASSSRCCSTRHGTRTWTSRRTGPRAWRARPTPPEARPRCSGSRPTATAARSCAEPPC